MDKETNKMAVKKYHATKKTRPPKFDYESERFLSYIGDLAQKGYTDRNIAYALVAEFGENLTPQHFNEMKNETDTKTGELTPRASKISEALARGREKLNLFARDTYFKTAVGAKKVKDVYRVFAERRCECGGDMECQFCYGTGKIVSERKCVVQEVERELPPNTQALSVWLFNHDKEWRENIIASKKLDITSGGKELNQAPRVLTKEEAKEYLKDIDKEY